MPAERVDERLETALGADVETLRRQGWRPPHEQAQQLPTITALASCHPDSPDAYDLVSWTVGKFFDNGGERSKAAMALFGLEKKRRQTVKQRNEAAARFLPYNTGESFRKSDEYVSLRDELTHQLVILAGELGFVLDDETVVAQAVPPPVEVEPESVLPGSTSPQPAAEEALDDAATSPRKRKRVAAVAVLALLLATATYTQLSHGSGRPVYDYHKPCTPHDPFGSCGPSGTSAVFNSGIHVDAYNKGDERDFLTARPDDHDPYPNYSDPLTNVEQVKSGKVIVQLYVHNNSQSYSAHNTHVGFTLPRGAMTDAKITGYVRADNASPRVVTDTVHLSANHPFTVRYVTGTAGLYTDQGVSLLGDRFNDMLIGDPRRSNGPLPGDFTGEVDITIRILPA